MAIKDWISGFLDRHKARFNPHDWPVGENSDESTEFLKGWVTAFALGRVCEEEADAASKRLTIAPPNYRREHIPMVLDGVKQLRAEKSPSAVTGGTRDAAKASSKGCIYCGGDGLAPVFHPYPDPDKKISSSAAAYCVCAHGRWIRKNHAETDPDLLRRIVDLDYVLSGASIYMEHDPAFRGNPMFALPTTTAHVERVA